MQLLYSMWNIYAENMLRLSKFVIQKFTIFVWDKISKSYFYFVKRKKNKKKDFYYEFLKKK